MAEPKGQYYGRGNRGLATVFGRQTRGDFADYAIQGEQMKARQDAIDAQRKREKRKEALEMVKVNDAFSLYKPSIDQQAYALIDQIAMMDNPDPAWVAKQSIRLNRLYEQGLAFEENMRKGAEVLEKDKRVVDGRKFLEERYNLDDTSVGALEANVKDDPLNNAYDFLNQRGGSKYINVGEAFKGVIDQIGETELSVMDDPQLRTIARGAGLLTQNQTSVKVKDLFEQGEDGSFRVKGVDRLMEEGLFRHFIDDKFTGRVINDVAASLHKAAGNEGPVPTDLKVGVLREILKGYEGGKIDEKKIARTYRYSVRDASDEGSPEKVKTADKWLTALRGGMGGEWESRARNQLVNTVIDGYRVENVVPLGDGQIKLTMVDVSRRTPVSGGGDDVFSYNRAAPGMKSAGPDRVDGDFGTDFHTYDIILSVRDDAEKLLSYYSMSTKNNKIPFGSVEAPTTVESIGAQESGEETDAGSLNIQ